MEKELQQLKEEVAKLRQKNISNEDMGVQNNFIEAEDIKNEITDLHLEIINDIEKYFQNIPSKIIENYVSIIRTQLNAFNVQVNNIDNLVKSGVHRPEYPGNRSNYISSFQQNETNFLKQLYDIKNSLRLEKIDGLLSDDDNLNVKIENTKKNLSQIEGMIKDAKEMLGDIADLSLVKTLKESAGSFDILRENHSKYEKRWFVAFCISSVLLLDQLFYYF